MRPRSSLVIYISAPRPRIKVLRVFERARRLSWAKGKLITELVAPSRNSTPIQVRFHDSKNSGLILKPGNRVELASVIKKLSVRLCPIDKK